MELAAAFVINVSACVEKRSVREVAAAHGVSKTWLYELLARYRKGGDPALKLRRAVVRDAHPLSSPSR